MNQEIIILSDKEVEEKLKNLPEWNLKNNKIAKQFEFSSFTKGIEFINSLVSFFEENDHHPDMQISYKKILFELTSYDVGTKLTNKDFLLAQEIEKRFKEYK